MIGHIINLINQDLIDVSNINLWLKRDRCVYIYLSVLAMNFKPTGQIYNYYEICTDSVIFAIRDCKLHLFVGNDIHIGDIIILNNYVINTRNNKILNN